MKISCPKCSASGTIADHDIPESGRFITCPRCKEGFTVNKPRSGSDVYLVDTCPSCSFSTFGDETFSACPKCGVEVKRFVERQREEQMLKHNQELLGKKHNNTEAALPPPEVTTTPVTDFIENLHPVNLISWGVATVAVTVLALGLLGIIRYDPSKIQTEFFEKTGEHISGLSVFLHHGLLHWVKILYGLSAVSVSILFMKRLKTGLRAMSYLLWTTIVLIPLSYITGFIYWVLAPIPHTISGYLIEVLNLVVMSSLAGVPLYMLERYLHERKITSIVKL